MFKIYVYIYIYIVYVLHNVVSENCIKRELNTQLHTMQNVRILWYSKVFVYALCVDLGIPLSKVGYGEWGLYGGSMMRRNTTGGHHGLRSSSFRTICHPDYTNGRPRRHHIMLINAGCLRPVCRLWFCFSFFPTRCCTRAPTHLLILKGRLYICILWLPEVYTERKNVLLWKWSPFGNLIHFAADESEFGNAQSQFHPFLTPVECRFVATVWNQ